MATKAAKSITINATKFELPNTLEVNDGKLQLKAKDVLVSETEVDTAFVIELAGNQRVTNTGSKTCTSFAAADLLDAIANNKTIKIVGHDLIDQNDNPGDELVWIPEVYYDEPAATVYFLGLVTPNNPTTVRYAICASFGTVSSINFY